MKKAGLLLMVLLLLLTGCGGEKNTPGNSDDNNNAHVSGESSEDLGNLDNDKKSKGYVFEYNDTVIAMNEKAEPILEKLGEPVDYFEAESCAFEGWIKFIHTAVLNSIPMR